MTESTEKNRRSLQGRVVSDKMAKTVTVLIERRVKHPVIGKIMTRSKKYHAHVDGLEAVTGDMVQIEECAPIAKTVAWRVVKVLEKARAV
ncbi:MAG: 30S ribosomal protein S17 [Rhodocyclaceae bacterium]|jgi:small subunit ribosomal protein S17|nr:30S ribosomal protein S17 [Rhodocyclaceae bacterium]